MKEEHVGKYLIFEDDAEFVTSLDEGLVDERAELELVDGLEVETQVGVHLVEVVSGREGGESEGDEEGPPQGKERGEAGKRRWLREAHDIK
jgi:hypothetical protein